MLHNGIGVEGFITHRIHDAIGQPRPSEGGAGTQEVVWGHQLHSGCHGGGELELGMEKGNEIATGNTNCKYSKVSRTLEKLDAY